MWQNKINICQYFQNSCDSRETDKKKQGLLLKPLVDPAGLEDRSGGPRVQPNHQVFPIFFYPPKGGCESRPQWGPIVFT